MDPAAPTTKRREAASQALQRLDTIGSISCETESLLVVPIRTRIGSVSYSEPRNLPDEIRVDVWDDTRIVPGSRWQGKIKEALDTATAAVLLLSPAFFRSQFISEHELPEVLGAGRPTSERSAWKRI